MSDKTKILIEFGVGDVHFVVLEHIHGSEEKPIKQYTVTPLCRIDDKTDATCCQVFPLYMLADLERGLMRARVLIKCWMK